MHLKKNVLILNVLEIVTIITCSVCECLVNGPPLLTIVSCWKRFSRLGGDERGLMVGESNGRSTGNSPVRAAEEPDGAVVDPLINLLKNYY